jgi:glucan-binding YG repeat protein
MVLSIIMVVGMMPVSAQAEIGIFPIDTSGEITAFEALGSEIAMRSVPIGTSERDLKLPDALMATVRLVASEAESLLDFGDVDLESEGGDTDSGPDTLIQTTTGAAITVDTDEIGDAQEEEPEFTETTIPMPVTWICDPGYDGETAGEYIFTIELPEGYTLADGVETPIITVIVVIATITGGTVSAFDELPENVRWQNTTTPEFPKTVSGTVGGKTADIPVTWEADHDYDAEYPQWGLYVFTAVLVEGYEIVDGVELPRITLYIPQTVGRMMARMAGGGTTDSPLEITTAAQLAEIATLVNARENGLEMFLFNDANAHVTLELQNDIDLSAYVNGNGWVSIGTSESPFGGVFDGGNNRITGLFINRNQNFQGLFGCVGSGGTLRNVSVVQTFIIGENYVGGVAGYVSGTVENCFVTGTISGAIGTGGVVGHLYSGTVQNCYSTATVSGGTNVGGVLGTASEGTLINCYSTGDISGTEAIGGVMGYLSGGAAQSCAALNPSVIGISKVGRMAGHTDSGVLSGNISFSGMTVTQGGGAKTLVEGEEQVDGASKTAADIRAASFFETLFENDTAWIYGEGKLPVLDGFSGQSDALPADFTGLAGTGTSDDPYQIYTAADLKYMADVCNHDKAFAAGKHFRLENDIDLAAYGKDYSEGAGWTPIGTNSNSFQGIFDGNKHEIKNLFINRKFEDYQGLFGYLDNGGTIRNLGVISIDITGKSFLGGVVAFVVGGVVENCYITGRINGNSFVGGVAGTVYSPPAPGAVWAVQNCYSTGDISGVAQIGGVVGYLSSGIVQKCYATGTISGAYIYDTGGSHAADNIGGVAGKVESGELRNCAALNHRIVDTFQGGRVAGGVSSGAILSDNIAFDDMEVWQKGIPRLTESDAGGVDGADKSDYDIYNESLFKELFGDDAAWSYAEGKLPGFGTAVSMPSHLLPSGISPFEGAGTSESNPYLIKTAADLAKLAELVNAGISPYANPNIYYRLENDIDLFTYGNDYDVVKGWTPIGSNMSFPFKGTFDGNNKSVTGLAINRPTSNYIGLFGYLYVDSKVHNLSIMGASIHGKASVGGVAGHAWGAAVENCAITGSIFGIERVGGIVGFTSSSKVRNCYSFGTVTGVNYVGGIAGDLEYTTTMVQSCYSESRISGSNYVGGVVGEVSAGMVQNCYSTGSVTGTGNYIGGVAGSVSTGSVQNCYSTGSVSGADSEGYIGGVLGALRSGTAKNCVALNPSIVAGTYNYGRVVGSNPSGTILKNYAFSRIPGTWSNKGPDAKDGADVTSQTLFGGNFFATAGNWDTAAWDIAVWTFADGKLPTLKGLAGQSGDGGLYLTARDIKYVTVSTGSFAYNGSEQIPTITFDGETLIKDTDYTVLITSTDGSGTSAGTNAGTVTLTLTGIGSFYGTKNTTYIIAKKPIIITPSSGQSKKYGGIDPILTFANDAGLAPGTFTGKLNRVVGENVGTYAIFLGSVSAGGNYELSLASGTVNFIIEQARVSEIAAAVNNVNKTAYEVRNATAAQAVVDAAGLPLSVRVITDGGTAMLPITWSTATTYNAKTAVYVVNGTLIGNENIDANSITKSITVTVAPVTAVNPTFSDTMVITNSDSSATAAELGSDILPTSGSITVEGVSVAYTINWNGGETLDRTTVGNEKTFTGVINYSSPPTWLTLPSGLTVSLKVTVTDKTLVTIIGITTANKTYDGTSYTPIGTVICSHSFPTNQLEWLYESTDGGSYSSTAAPTNAGAYKLTISVPDSNANYTGSEAFTFIIEKRQITLAADYKWVIKGSSLPELTYTVGNLASGKTKTDALSAEPVLACSTFDGNAPGGYAITLIGGTATDNYTITTRTNGTLTVAEQTYTVTFNLNGGSHTGGGELTQTIAEGSAAMAPTVSRRGYTFTGWDKAFDSVTSNLTVTANWSYNGGGGGGSSSGENSTTTTTTAPGKTPDQPVTAAVSVTATAGKNGTASVAIPEKSVTDAIAKAKADAKAQGKTANGTTVALNIIMPKGATSLMANLTHNSLNSLVSAGGTSLELNGSPVKVTFDAKALAEIQKQSSGNISINIVPNAKLSSAAKTMIGTRPVYDMTVNYTKSGKNATVTSFGGGTATVSIPYTLGKKEAVGGLYAVYMDEKGNATRIVGSVYDTNSSCVIFTTTHFSRYGVGYTAPSAKFTDISSHWAKESIDYVVGRGLLSGTSETTFTPNSAMTQGMLVTALGRLANVDTKAYTTSSFTDVKADSTFRPYIEWAYKKGIVQGTGNGKFEADRAVTREEIAVIFSNYAKATGYTLPVTRTATAYADASSIGSAYKTAVTAMQQAGIVMGDTGNKFNPKASATRAEVSSMLSHYIKLTIDPDTAQGWAKNDAEQYLYYKDGKALTGTQTIDGVKYFFNTDGTLKSGWVKDGGNWRFYSVNIMLIGFWDIDANGNNKTYYFTKDGIMVSGKWLEIDGKWYYFYAAGSLARSTKIDEYEVDVNGVRKIK